MVPSMMCGMVREGVPSCGTSRVTTNAEVVAVAGFISSEKVTRRPALKSARAKGRSFCQLIPLPATFGQTGVAGILE